MDAKGIGSELCRGAVAGDESGVYISPLSFKLTHSSPGVRINVVEDVEAALGRRSPSIRNAEEAKMKTLGNFLWLSLGLVMAIQWAGS